MKSEYSCYVLLLSYIDDNRTDIGGTVFPEEGFIESKNFKKDINIRNGLTGILWGESNTLPYEKINKGFWLVIKTEKNDDFIRTDILDNRYKFPNGTILYCGDLISAANYIIEHKNDDDLDSHGKEVRCSSIVGSQEWLENHPNAGRN